jgi:hypothetical protein
LLPDGETLSRLVPEFASTARNKKPRKGAGSDENVESFLSFYGGAVATAPHFRDTVTYAAGPVD